MKKIILFLKSEPFIIAGIILIIFSGGIFWITSEFFVQASNCIFLINYLITIGFSIAVLIKNGERKKKKLLEKQHLEKNCELIYENKLKYNTLILLLGYISAFSLNREMNVFDSSVFWLCIYILISSFMLLVAVFIELFSKTLKFVLFFFLGAALILFLYYAIYLLPLYIFSIPGLLALGISLHTYVPALLAVLTLAYFYVEFKRNRRIAYAFVAGAALPLIICSIFLNRWNQTNGKINQILNQQSLNDGKLPAWVVVSQKIEKSFTADRILKMGLLYHEVDLRGNLFWDMPSHLLDEPKLHDPLVVIASFIFNRPNLDEKERIKVLKSMYDVRHHTQERLWSGDDLETVSVISNVKIFPEYRMAYTEKTLTIRNRSVMSWNKQEAIYTFHLSEGSAVTSLSLWINGQEEKSRLTTKAKADSTYKTIVGIENHDPSVIHWQEGNTVSVRVFPCPTNENRKFRVGISSPLRRNGDRLTYENIFFEGPIAEKTLETVQLSFSKTPLQFQGSGNYKEVSPNVFQAERNYEPYWEISCKVPPISNNGFSFGGSSYVVKEYKHEYASFEPKVIYLDLNNSWSKEELIEVWAHIKSKPVFVYQNGLCRLDSKNLEQIFEQSKEDNFSLFPVNKIAEPDASLIISKSTSVSPNLQDLEGSRFAKNIINYLQKPKQIRIFNIGDQLSPYLKAFKELRVLNYDSGKRTELFQHLGKHEFIKCQENDSTVVIDHAKMMIKQVNTLIGDSAPDHLLRLFAYNDIMKKVGSDYFNPDFQRTDLINEAEKANVVSPVSSLLVLETQKDYERFNIESSKNSLKNASMKSSGAVPEPHEWLLILIVLIIGAYLLIVKKSVSYE